ncbi:MAG: acetate--CoA ligase family protein [Candidatus Bathyarchaeia archaeon]
MYEYTLILNSPIEEEIPQIEIDVNKIWKIIQRVKSEGRSTLTIDEAMIIAEAAGIPMPKAAVARSREEAGRLADEVGYPLAMKIISPDILHKTDIGGVVLGVKNRAEAEETYELLVRRVRTIMPRAKILGVLVQKNGAAR